MNVLQLCVFTNHWGEGYEVESWDLKNGRNVYDMDLYHGRNFDIICAAPPCDQFTRANCTRWDPYPSSYVELARHCLLICLASGRKWFLENPPGRITTFLPELIPYRAATWSGPYSNKEYVVYSNFLFLYSPVKRYGKSVIPRNKLLREEWLPEFVQALRSSL